MIDSKILSRAFDTSQLPADGVETEFVADEEERAGLAAAYGPVAVNALSATARLTPIGKGAVEVEGRVVADIVQSCVVSLEPVAQHIDETFAARFVPADAPEVAGQGGKEVVIDPAAPDPPEVMDGTTIDLGALVEEMFVLAIDPYPRAPGAVLPEVGEEEEGERESPFAVLRDAVKTKG